MLKLTPRSLAFLLAALLLPHEVAAQAAGVAAPAAEGIPETEADVELAQQLANPLASLVSVSSVFDAENRVGPSDDGRRFRLQIQPIVPFDLGRNVKVVTRTIVPLVSQTDTLEDRGHQLGFGDLVFTAFLAPRHGFNIGVGPSLLLPTATRTALGARKVGLGPSAALLDVRGPFTYGLLANHLWSIRGADERSHFSRTTLQPFLAYTTPLSWTFTAQVEPLYDWYANDWSVPVGLLVSKLTHVAGTLTSIGMGVRYWAATPADGAHGFALRLALAFVYPNKPTTE